VKKSCFDEKFIFFIKNVKKVENLFLFGNWNA